MQLTRDQQLVDLKGLPADVAALIERLQQDLERKQTLIERQSREIAWRDAKLEKVAFELARLKRWKFGASSEAMSAQQRALFEEAMAEDEASLQAQLAALKASLPQTSDKPKVPPRKPRRQRLLPEHLRRVEHRHEPKSTDCGCGAPVVRVGEDVSERLDIIPAEFFVHRHIYGKWACRCCQKLMQPSAVPEIVEGGIAASGFVAHTLISRFVDHLPYYRQEKINARSGVHTPRSTLASLSGQGGAALEPLYEVHKGFVLQALLGGAAGPPGREQPPWRGTLLSDQYAAYGAVVSKRTCQGRMAAACLAHARRYFEELAKTGASDVAHEAIGRIARIYRADGQFAAMDDQQRLAARKEIT